MAEEAEKKEFAEASLDTQFERMIGKIEEVDVTSVSGRITETIGMIIRAIVPNVKIGEVCLVKGKGMEPLMCEVIGFTSEEVILSPLRRHGRHRPFLRGDPHPPTLQRTCRTKSFREGPRCSRKAPRCATKGPLVLKGSPPS